MDKKLLKIEQAKKAGKIIVFTNGVFDIVHRGHITYLNKAKSLGDYLVVGINSDASVKRLKGASRPINNQSNRKFLLKNLKAVDDVIIFEEDTPYKLISKIIPNILVKGGDWRPDQIVGSDIVKRNGGKVLSLKFIDNYSSSLSIKRILEKAMEAAILFSKTLH